MISGEVSPFVIKSKFDDLAETLDCFFEVAKSQTPQENAFLNLVVEVFSKFIFKCDAECFRDDSPARTFLFKLLEHGVATISTGSSTLPSAIEGVWTGIKSLHLRAALHPVARLFAQFFARFLAIHKEDEGLVRKCFVLLHRIARDSIEANLSFLPASKLAEIADVVAQLSLPSLEKDRVALHLSLLTVFCNACRPRKPRNEIVARWLRYYADFYTAPNFAFKPELHLFMVAAVKAVGPAEFLQTLPLNIAPFITDAAVSPRAFLLPVLKEGVFNATIRWFIDCIVPVLDDLSQKIEAFYAASKTTDAKVFEIVYYQIFDVLPGLCTFPVDLHANAPFIDWMLRHLERDSRVAPVICRSLALLIASCDAQKQSSVFLYEKISSDAQQASLQLLVTSSPKILNILFDVYRKTNADSRGFILDAIEAVIVVCQQDAVEAVFKTSLKHLLAISDVDIANNPTLASEKCAYFDVVVKAIPRLSADTHDLLLKFFVSNLASPTSTLQKRAYKGLSALLATNPEAAECAVETHFSLWRKVVCEHATSNSGACRVNRLAVLLQLTRIMPMPCLSEIVASLLPECVLSLKEINEKSREQAFDLLVTLAIRFNTSQSLNLFVDALLAGLASPSALMLSGTLVALSKIVFEFGRELPPETVRNALQLVLAFENVENGEIIKACLEYIKIASKALPSAEFAAVELPKVCHVLVHWSALPKSPHKASVKNIFEKFLRSFGFDAVAAHVPEEYAKVLRNIRKVQNKKKSAISGARQTATNSSGLTPADSQSSSEEDGEEILPPEINRSIEFMPSGTSRSSSSTALTLAAGADGVVDLMDKRALMLNFARKPKSLLRAQRSADATEEDGRFVFLESDVDDEEAVDWQDEDDAADSDGDSRKKISHSAPRNPQKFAARRNDRPQPAVKRRSNATVAYVPLSVKSASRKLSGHISKAAIKKDLKKKFFTK